jgi:hypothetical protein
MPLVWNGQLYGVLQFDNKGAESGLDISHLNFLANHTHLISKALYSIRSLERLSFVNDLNRFINSNIYETDVLFSIVSHVNMQFDSCMTSLFIYEQDINKIMNIATCVKGIDEPIDIKETYDVGTYIVGKAFKNKKCINIFNFEEYAKINGVVNSEYINQYELELKRKYQCKISIKNGLFVPILFDNQAVGVIRLVNSEKFDGSIPFCREDLGLAITMVSQLSHLLRNILSTRNIEKITEKIINGYALSGLENAIDFFVSESRKILSAEFCSLFLKERDRYRLISESTLRNEIRHPNVSIELSDAGYTGYIAKQRYPINISRKEIEALECARDLGCISTKLLSSESVLSSIGSPIYNFKGELLGIVKYFNKMNIFTEKPHDFPYFTNHDLVILKLLLNKITDLITINDLLKNVESMHDNLFKVNQVTSLAEVVDGVVHDARDNIMAVAKAISNSKKI